MRATTVFEQRFPKFLIGDSADDRTFVIHLHHPQFVGEVQETGVMPCSDGGGVEIKAEFIDDPAGITASELATLMRQAGDFYLSEIERE
jgi:hypothetical protein